MIPGIVAASLRKRALGAGDPDWNSVFALLNAKGADGSHVPIDATGRVWTPRGAFQIDDSPGHNVMLLSGGSDGADTAYLGAYFDWWTHDFTIDAVIAPANLSTWSYVDGSLVPQLIACAEPGTYTNYWSFGPAADGQLMFYYFNGSGAVRISGGSVPNGAETRIRMTHTVGEGIRLLVGASLVAGPVAVSGSPIANVTGMRLTMGRVLSSIAGAVRGLRISKGVARTSDPGTPPWPTQRAGGSPVVTWSPIDKTPSIILSGGNLVATRSGVDNYQSVRATHALLPGRCCEFYIASAQPSPFCMVGVSSRAESLSNYAGATVDGYAYYQQTGVKTHIGSNTPYGPDWSSGDVIGMARIGDELHFWKNGSPLGAAFTLPADVDFYPVTSMYRDSHVIALRATSATMSQAYGGCVPIGG
ncbi:SPRY domain-containing protein [Luteimonas sp. SMYT11W]|uniref:SPRY domain-containing protein n=1 Tax=Luteimonas flava TaxID=3115822 RepID=A0ABU7WD05_9GAMM